MKKVLTFQQPSVLPRYRLALEILFPFTMIDSSLIGRPEEKSRTSQHELKVSITDQLLIIWGFPLVRGLSQDNARNLLRILFEYAKRYVTDKLETTGKLAQREELDLNTSNSEMPCPFDPSLIQDPAGATCEVHIDTLEKESSMEVWKISTISKFARALNDLKSLNVDEQSCLLLRRLATLERDRGPRGFHRGNLALPDLMDLADGFPPNEKSGVTDLLLGAPWQRLVNDGYIVERGGDGFFYVTDEGYEAASACEKASNKPFDRVILSAIELLHPDFRNYGHYFREGKLKEAVAAAFERYENRLNEIRDKSNKAAVRNASGQSLIYMLFQHGLLKNPYPRLGSNKAKKEDLRKALCSILSGGLGWIRNPYEHEKHQLPDLKPLEALELLSVASYLLRLIEASVVVRKQKKAPSQVT